MADRSGERLIADNRKARHDFHLFDTYEAGIVLLGTEVKAIREGRVNLRDSYGRIEDGEVFLCNVHISPYSHRGYATHEPLRRRKLLLNRTEIQETGRQMVERALRLCRGPEYVQGAGSKWPSAWRRARSSYDKRETIRRREIDRETRAMLKGRSR